MLSRHCSKIAKGEIPLRKIIGRFVAILILSAIIMMLTGCSRNDSAMVGRWRSSNAPGLTIEFNRNGTGLVNDSIGFTWSAENGRLTLAGFPDNFSEEIGWPPHVPHTAAYVPRITATEEVLLESDDHDGEAAVLDISVNWNGIHDYRIRHAYGSTSLTIFLPGDAAHGFTRLGEN